MKALCMKSEIKHRCNGKFRFSIQNIANAIHLVQPVQSTLKVIGFDGHKA